MEQDKLKFILPLPPTQNHSYGTRYASKLKRSFMYMTKDAKDWKDNAQKIISSEYKGEVIEDEVAVTIHWYLKYQRDYDGVKIVNDMLEGIVIKNDRQIKEAHIFVSKEPKDPRVVVEITKI